MSNFEDLKAARTIARLGQKEAAQKAGVSPEYLCRMEKGKAPIPEATYAKFLEAIGKTQADVDAHFASLPASQQPPTRQITDEVVEEYMHGLPRPKAEALCASIMKKHPQPAPAKIEYDRKGYPLNVGPFDAVEFGECGVFGGHAPEIEDALIEIEGADFPKMDRIRQVKYTERRWPNNKDEDHLEQRAKHLRKWDTENAVYFVELARDKDWPEDEEKAHAILLADWIKSMRYDDDGYPLGIHPSGESEELDAVCIESLRAWEGELYGAMEQRRVEIGQRKESQRMADEDLA